MRILSHKSAELWHKRNVRKLLERMMSYDKNSIT